MTNQTLAPGVAPESRSQEGGRAIDLPGAVTVTAGLAVLVYAVVEAADAGWGSAQTIILLIVAAALLTLFVAIEQRTEVPLVRLGLFRLRTVSGANAVVLTAMAAIFGLFFFLSLYMQQVLGYTAFETGVAFLPLATGFVIGSGIATQLVGRVGFKPVIILGLVIFAVGLYLLSRVSVDGTFLENILPGSLVSALGGALAVVSLIIAGTTGVEERESGLASGLINSSQQIGAAFGLAILATVATSRTADLLAEGGGDPAAVPNALTEGFQDAFLAGAVIVLLGAVLAVGLLPARESESHRAETAESPEAQLAEDLGLARCRVPAFGGLFCRSAFGRLIGRGGAGDEAPADSGSGSG